MSRLFFSDARFLKSVKENEYYPDTVSHDEIIKLLKMDGSIMIRNGYLFRIPSTTQLPAAKLSYRLSLPDEKNTSICLLLRKICTTLWIVLIFIIEIGFVLL